MNTYFFECSHTLNSKDEFMEVRFVLSTRELYSAFEILAKNRGGKCPFKSVRQLGARLNDSMRTLADIGWSYQARVKTVRGEPKHALIKTFAD